MITYMLGFAHLFAHHLLEAEGRPAQEDTNLVIILHVMPTDL